MLSNETCYDRSPCFSLLQALIILLIQYTSGKGKVRGSNSCSLEDTLLYAEISHLEGKMCVFIVLRKLVKGKI